MQTISKGYRGLSVLMDLNWDRALYLCTIAFALCAGAYLGSLLSYQGFLRQRGLFTRGLRNARAFFV